MEDTWRRGGRDRSDPSAAASRAVRSSGPTAAGTVAAIAAPACSSTSAALAMRLSGCGWGWGGGHGDVGTGAERRRANRRSCR